MRRSRPCINGAIHGRCGVYLMMALASGAVFACAVLTSTGIAPQGLFTFAAIVLLVAWRVKRSYWQYIDTTQHAATPASATGLTGASVKLLERAAHRRKLSATRNGLQGRPKACGEAAQDRPYRDLCSAFGPDDRGVFERRVCRRVRRVFWRRCRSAFGLITERWLFFAEARHVVTLYYGAQAA